MDTKIKKIVAREGLLLLAAIVVAYFSAQEIGLKNFMMDIGIVKPRANAADAVLQEATIGGFLFILLVVYPAVRFIFWAIRALKKK